MSPGHHTPGMGPHRVSEGETGGFRQRSGAPMCVWGCGGQGGPYTVHQQPTGDAVLDSGAGIAPLELCDLRPLIEPLWAPGL